MPQSISVSKKLVLHFQGRLWHLPVLCLCCACAAAAAASLTVSGSCFPFKGHRQQNLTGGDTDRLQIWSFLV